MANSLLTKGLVFGLALSLGGCAVYTPAPRVAYAPAYYAPPPPAYYGPVYPAVGVHVGFYDHPRYWR